MIPLESIDQASLLTGVIIGMLVVLIPQALLARWEEWLDTRVNAKARRMFEKWKKEYETKGEDGIDEQCDQKRDDLEDRL